LSITGLLANSPILFTRHGASLIGVYRRGVADAAVIRGADDPEVLILRKLDQAAEEEKPV
jgi:hypothetical protein